MSYVFIPARLFPFSRNAGFFSTGSGQNQWILFRSNMTNPEKWIWIQAPNIRPNIRMTPPEISSGSSSFSNLFKDAGILNNDRNYSFESGPSSFASSFHYSAVLDKWVVLIEKETGVAQNVEPYCYRSITNPDTWYGCTWYEGDIPSTFGVPVTLTKKGVDTKRDTPRYKDSIQVMLSQYRLQKTGTSPYGKYEAITEFEEPDPSDSDTFGNRVYTVTSGSNLNKRTSWNGTCISGTNNNYKTSSTNLKRYYTSSGSLLISELDESERTLGRFRCKSNYSSSPVYVKSSDGTIVTVNHVLFISANDPHDGSATFVPYIQNYNDPDVRDKDPYTLPDKNLVDASAFFNDMTVTKSETFVGGDGSTVYSGSNKVYAVNMNLWHYGDSL